MTRKYLFSEKRKQQNMNSGTKKKKNPKIKWET